MPLRRSPVSDPSEMKSLREVSLRTFAAVLLLASPMTAETADAVLERAAAIRWEPVGLSGGGSGAYVSDNGGRDWRMINAKQLRSSGPIVPH